MTRGPEFSKSELQSEVPELINFLNTRPDEELRILRLENPSLEVATVEIIKLETPRGTDDVAMSGYQRVTKISLLPVVNYLKDVDLKSKNELEKNRFNSITNSVKEIQELLA